MVETLQFTNRFVDAAWGGDVIPTPDGRPHPFVRTTQGTASPSLFSLVLGEVTDPEFPPSPVILQVADERGDWIEGAFVRRASVTARSRSDLWVVPFFPRRGPNLWLRLFDRCAASPSPRA